ncbi:MAG: hypothetical protein CMC93_05050 [Flavobacteriaceae bacterium]|nr:hypothetical protein [Flavobacteriaceae bacterium]
MSPVEKSLNVNESVQRNICAFDLNAQGNISNKKLFHNYKTTEWMGCDAIYWETSILPDMEKVP